jgi:hypothetical protein
MKRPKLLSRLVRYTPVLGWLFVSGCLVNAERNLDMVLSPGAVDNALTLPYSAVANLGLVLSRLLFR